MLEDSSVNAQRIYMLFWGILDSMQAAVWMELKLIIGFQSLIYEAEPTAVRDHSHDQRRGTTMSKRDSELNVAQ